MAINNISTASKFSSELDKVIVSKAVTGFFADNVLRAKFVGAKTVLIPDIDFVGLADYDRDTGFSKAKTTVSNTSYELSKDRARSLQLDREEMDESGIANLAGQVLGEYVRTMVVPEMDAYVLSELYKVADTHGHTVEFDEAKVYSQLVSLINNVQSRAGFDEELVAFVNPRTYAALMNCAELNRQLVVSDFKQGEVDLKVKSLNGVAIIPVADDRMKTDIVFDGGEDTTSGGYTVSDASKDICMLVIPKKGASLVKKTETMRIFTPEQNTEADAYIFNYRVYYDVFVKKSGLELVEAAFSDVNA